MLCIGTTSCGFTFYLFLLLFTQFVQTSYCKEKQGADRKNYFELCNLPKVHVHVHWFSSFIILSRGYCNFNIASMYRMCFNMLIKKLWKNKVITTYLKRSKQYNSYHVDTTILFNFLSSNIFTQILFTGALVTLQPKPKIRLS